MRNAKNLIFSAVLLVVSTLAALTIGELVLRIKNGSMQNYDIEMTTSLSSGPWTRTATVPGPYSGTHALYQDIFIPAPARFCRVRGNLLP